MCLLIDLDHWPIGRELKVEIVNVCFHAWWLWFLSYLRKSPKVPIVYSKKCHDKSTIWSIKNYMLKYFKESILYIKSPLTVSVNWRFLNISVTTNK